MKKTAIFLLMIIIILNLASCGLLGMDSNGGDDGKKTPPVSDIAKPDDTPTDENKEPDKPNGDNNEDENLNSNLIKISSIKGYNEAIFVEIDATDGFDYQVYYKETTSDEYIKLDDNLIVESESKISC